MKTDLDFKNAVLEKDISFWYIRDCSICNYPCGYLFSGANDPKFDAGCDCTRRYVHEQRTWDEVANYYNSQTHENYINRMNDFWGF